MSERPLTKPDITITIDSEGVIRSAVSGRRLRTSALRIGEGGPGKIRSNPLSTARS